MLIFAIYGKFCSSYQAALFAAVACIMTVLLPFVLTRRCAAESQVMRGGQGYTLPRALTYPTRPRLSAYVHLLTYVRAKSLIFASFGDFSVITITTTGPSKSMTIADNQREVSFRDMRDLCLMILSSSRSSSGQTASHAHRVYSDLW